MTEIVKRWRALRHDRRAVTAMEFALIAALLVGGVAVAFGGFAENVSTKISSLGGSL